MHSDSKPERAPRRPVGRLLAVAIAATFALAGIAFAVTTGLQNGSFEEDLTGWSASTVRYDTYNRDVVYGPEEQAALCDAGGLHAVCVVGEDRFTVRDNVYDIDREVVVAPNDGDKMLRLGGPFLNAGVPQEPGLLTRVEQQFTVDAAQPVLQLRFNAFTWDYEGFDQVEFRVRLTDENGDVIARNVQGAFGSGVSLKTTGWIPANVDLTGYEGQQVLLEIESGGTSDSLYGFWAYIDAGFAAGDPTPDPVVDAPDLPGGGEVPIDRQENTNGEVWFSIGNSSVGQFPSDCMPLDVTVPIDPGAGVVSNASLILRPQLPGQPAQADRTFSMANVGGNNWKGTIDCVATGSMFVKYDLTEGGVTQTFVIPIGGITLIDPQGVVYDRVDYDAALAAHGDTDATATAAEKTDAREEAAIEGATARLQREVGGAFVNVLSGDPGISPKVNPQTTGANGLYQWDVSEGDYRVVVSKNGYITKTSDEVHIPPPVLDLHIPMEREAPDLPETSITDGPAEGATTTDNTPTFGFTSPDGGATFECRIDSTSDAAWAACTSPHTLAALANGSHTFEVRAKTGAGADGSPATRTFTVAVSAPTPPGDGDGGDDGGDGGGGTTSTDTDNDGFVDSSDACPTQPGTAPDGCPKAPTVPNDTDGDGFADAVDACPTVAGKDPNGCPPPATPAGDPKCFGLSGQKRATCLWLSKQQASCAKKFKGKKAKVRRQRALCIKRAKALAKCQALKRGKKRKNCVADAKKIGAKKKGTNRR